LLIAQVLVGKIHHSTHIFSYFTPLGSM